MKKINKKFYENIKSKKIGHAILENKNGTVKINEKAWNFVEIKLRM